MYAAAAVEAVTKMTGIGGSLWGSTEGAQLAGMLPRLRRNLVAAVARAAGPIPNVIRRYVMPTPHCPPASPIAGRQSADPPQPDAARPVSTRPLGRPVASGKGHPTRRPTDRAELLAAFQNHCGSVPALAAAYGVHRLTMYRWLNRLGIELRHVRGCKSQGKSP